MVTLTWEIIKLMSHFSCKKRDEVGKY